MSDTDPYYSGPVVEVAKVVASFDQPVAEKPVEAPVAVEEAVPEGSIKAVLAWVGDDAAKAQSALTVEKSGEKRSTLLSKLEAIIN